MARQTFTVNCTQDKFEAVRDCFDDVCENPKFSDRSQSFTVQTFSESFSNKPHQVTFQVESSDEYSMEFANFMVRCWNK